MMTKALTQRQETLLALIVREYTETAKPVGSKRLVERYNLGISSATVRNEMAELTHMGYLRQPHNLRPPPYDRSCIVPFQ
ncbi:MAG TPA: hypothetical protein ENL35_09480, partial [Chloroflexi bacterium]|nr:hypothetical protein [Chloroflexota bacterium]